MRMKALALVLIVGISLVLFGIIRKDNRADAAAGDCYAAAQGPSSPTICE
jgi:hypothetical protein